MAAMTQTPRRAVMLEVPPHILEWRKRTGADRFDEVWEGVIHMSPSPSNRHQGLSGELAFWLKTHWARRGHGKVFVQCNVARPGIPKWLDDYRIPDLALLEPGCAARDLDTHFAGGPSVVVEVYSPGDESYDKLPFYFDIGVEEVWVIHRDTKVPEIFVRGAKAFRVAKANRAGWLVSKATGIEMRAVSPNQLALRLASDPATQALVPDPA